MTRVSTGIKFEYAVRDYFLSKGYNVIRSAGSRGAVDLFVWTLGDVQLIQCKKELTKTNYDKDLKKLLSVECSSSWKKRLWIKHGKNIMIKDEFDNLLKTLTIKEVNNQIKFFKSGDRSD